ncbi:twin-arginine translocase subunit TatC [Sporosarcina pasteurii]|uniref:Sec-independent protein translocase protein TatC n=1 Tax=Sporosarcina pasteurii TaxID=1474 RepID=A0A380CA04_SPOPA|nr:twin-arginine translocase subunit TatC [Sporosarcina pasteurii]MDS9472719.1 twin-arginine translocase subunit TatC [Sporosarcina pasteurii]QBQ04374.1 twin-arginine translocase subunit TatC [Sporosarcina pasteurii]SUJ15488.1 Sec-independent protein translocase protein TatCd [Sporosarcina pasteurii]
MRPTGDHNHKSLSPLDKENAEIEVKTERDLKDDDQVVEEQDSKTEETPSLPLVAHLGELRKQLIKSIVVFILFFVIVFATINIWFPYVTRGHQLIVLGPLEVVKFYMSISIALAVGLALPFVCHFLWQFVGPGLNENERRFLSLYAPVMLLLFVGGLAFGYFVVNPISYNFLTTLGAVNFDVMISAQEYVSFLLMTTVPLGLIFELPIVAMFLAAIGLLTADSMKKVRRWSYLALAVVSALITPPDFISQLIVLIPMMLLYETSIYIVRRAEQRSA